MPWQGSELRETSVQTSHHCTQPGLVTCLPVSSLPFPAFSPEYSFLYFTQSHWHSTQPSQIPMILFPLSEAIRKLWLPKPRQTLRVEPGTFYWPLLRDGRLFVLGSISAVPHLWDSHLCVLLFITSPCTFLCREKIKHPQNV